MKCPYCDVTYINEDAFYNLTLQTGETKFKRICPYCEQEMLIEVEIKVSKIHKEEPE